ncbi:hypothetical protein RSal33209_3313 [Renibacterium salmoninarum ATCC 33209]|uniref:Uncharacterized protein n=1 Tax=Renibacterium salmoninarum (strain ATCC 33209 / DSM 20767 / JCM 11484 / NBRC 15589 / NCIMB 2235) TaxID=288705 RepID=A9WV04_RENSM|nr:hypothetical protein RSal33209_3313 [Renibacterium salmoninarum ATCC 33209]
MVQRLVSQNLSRRLPQAIFHIGLRRQSIENLVSVLIGIFPSYPHRLLGRRISLGALLFLG